MRLTAVLGAERSNWRVKQCETWGTTGLVLVTEARARFSTGCNQRHQTYGPDVTVRQVNINTKEDINMSTHATHTCTQVSDKDRSTVRHACWDTCYMFVRADVKQCKSAWLLSHASIATPWTHLYSLSLFKEHPPVLLSFHSSYSVLSVTVTLEYTQTQLRPFNTLGYRLFSEATFIFSNWEPWVTAVRRAPTPYRLVDRGWRDGHLSPPPFCSAC